jgi:hypothetical protein
MSRIIYFRALSLTPRARGDKPVLTSNFVGAPFGSHYRNMRTEYWFTP